MDLTQIFIEYLTIEQKNLKKEKKKEKEKWKPIIQWFISSFH